MLDDKKIEEAARLDDKEYYDRLSTVILYAMDVFFMTSPA